MSLVYIIEDEPIMAECMALAVEGVTSNNSEGEVVHPRIEQFTDAVTAVAALREEIPDAILLDVLLTGPNGFAFLNEISSYTDTANIPVILVSSLDLSGRDLSSYSIIRVLDKNTMTPEDIQSSIRIALSQSSTSPAVTTGDPTDFLSISGLNAKLAAAEAEVNANTNSPILPSSPSMSASNINSPNPYSSDQNNYPPQNYGG